MAVFLKTGEDGNISLPAPVKISVSDEIIWSANTGRSTESGKMIGDVVAEKKTVDIEWGVLDADDMKKISDNLKSGFYPVWVYDNGEMTKIVSYRGTLKKEYLGLINGTHYYKSATVSIIQQ